MKTYSLTIGDLHRKLPVVPISKHLSVASFMILGDTELVETAASLLVEKLPDVDVIATTESKSQAFTYEVSKCLNHKKFIVARRSLKPYMKKPLMKMVNSMSINQNHVLYLDGIDADFVKGKRVALVDDVISRGRSLKALKELIEEAGGEVVAQAAILAEGNAAKRDDIIYLATLPLFENKD